MLAISAADLLYNKLIVKISSLRIPVLEYAGKL